MCTVTIVPAPEPGSWRMACSRDEGHGRAPAVPPAASSVAGRGVLMPVDPSSQGTWVAANDAGLAITLLNYNLPEPPVGRTMSRGTVIPALIGCATLDEAVALLPTIDTDAMMPFRLVLCDGQQVVLWRSTEPPNHTAGLDVGPLDRPVMFTSSGLGDHLIEPPRRALFEGWFGDDPEAYLDRQQAFHAHRWEDRPHLSIAMSRDEARTVSYTVVDLSDEAVAMRYHPDRPDLPAAASLASLHRLTPSC